MRCKTIATAAEKAKRWRAQYIAAGRRHRVAAGASMTLDEAAEEFLAGDAMELSRIAAATRTSGA